MAEANEQKTGAKGAAGPVTAKKSNGLGLGDMGDLSALLDAPAAAEGAAAELPIDSIVEDPDQPRTEFPEHEMKELAESIQAFGVKVPILVSRLEGEPGKFKLEDGARRYRGSILAGKDTIPAVVVAEKFSKIEQLIVNKIRVDTPPMDKARTFADVMKSERITQRQLAERSKFSEAYISQHLALLNLPEPIASVFDSGRGADVTVINELAKAYKKNAEAVEDWLADEDQEITRGSVRTLREFIDAKGKPAAAGEGPHDDEQESEGGGDTQTPAKEKTEKEQDPDKIKKAIILGIVKKRPCRLLTSKRWSAEGFGWVKYEDDGSEEEVELGQFKVNRLMEA